MRLRLTRPEIYKLLELTSTDLKDLRRLMYSRGVDKAFVDSLLKVWDMEDFYDYMAEAYAVVFTPEEILSVIELHEHPGVKLMIERAVDLDIRKNRQAEEYIKTLQNKFPEIS